MNGIRECQAANPIHGSLLRLSGRREIAIYLRDGAAWVAEFCDGRSKLCTAGAWFASSAGRSLVHAQRRGEVETITPLPRTLVPEIEALHRHAPGAVVGPAVWRFLTTLISAFRQSLSHFQP
ncbi:MAG TPA: hypothetical protein VKF40_21255 [Burkholderiales bacterium]|nr:hypothetical protein [Burkholderiales bacterium]